MGGDNTSVQSQLANKRAQRIYASQRDFAAVLEDGSVVTWGGSAGSQSGTWGSITGRKKQPTCVGSEGPFFNKKDPMVEIGVEDLATRGWNVYVRQLRELR